MIVSIGTDICAIARIEQSLQRFGKRFTERVLTPAERTSLPSAGAAAYVAKRFAAKEALGKALGTGIGGGVSWQDIEVIRVPGRAADIRLEGAAEKLAREMGVRKVLLSLSDERDFALAFVVLEG